MATRITTEDITMEEARILGAADDDFFGHGETDAKCPRCGGAIVLQRYGTSYTIGCEYDCVVLAYRGI
jgi:predicted RNA-binding Zn-ribbon protein involved in translation (DUF1610 family)